MRQTHYQSTISTLQFFRYGDGDSFYGPPFGKKSSVSSVILKIPTERPETSGEADTLCKTVNADYLKYI
jgi:hypothetical protein